MWYLSESLSFFSSQFAIFFYTFHLTKITHLNNFYIPTTFTVQHEKQVERQRFSRVIFDILISIQFTTPPHVTMIMNSLAPSTQHKSRIQRVSSSSHLSSSIFSTFRIISNERVIAKCSWSMITRNSAAAYSEASGEQLEMKVKHYDDNRHFTLVFIPPMIENNRLHHVLSWNPRKLREMRKRLSGMKSEFSAVRRENSAESSLRLL